jgi:hypothetical protein
MYISAFVRRKAQTGAKPRGRGRRAFEQAQIVGAATGLFGGVTAGLFGSVFTAAGWFVANDGARQWLLTTGSI